jgi:hypothetical protein
VTSRPGTIGLAQTSPPELPRKLGYAGLLPQIAVVAVLLSGSQWWRFAALSIGYAYAALILSFLGGMWWGLAARGSERIPLWIWLAAVTPSLLALATYLPWIFGATWPGPSLAVLGTALLASLMVDRRLVAYDLTPAWWMALRLPLSIGLGLLTIVAAGFA